MTNVENWFNHFGSLVSSSSWNEWEPLISIDRLYSTTSCSFLTTSYQISLAPLSLYVRILRTYTLELFGGKLKPKKYHKPTSPITFEDLYWTHMCIFSGIPLHARHKSIKRQTKIISSGPFFVHVWNWKGLNSARAVSKVTWQLLHKCSLFLHLGNFWHPVK